MDFRFTDEQRIWRDTVHSFMEKEVGREYTREHDASREFPWEVYRKMARLGWLGLLLPERDGGSAADPVMFAILRSDRQIQPGHGGLHHDLDVHRHEHFKSRHA